MLVLYIVSFLSISNVVLSYGVKSKSVTLNTKAFALSHSYADIKETLTNANRIDFNFSSLDEFADSLIEEIKTYALFQGYDPVELEDIYEEFEWKILLITYKGKLDLTNGWMQGLSTTYRTDEVILTLTDRLFNIEIPISFQYVLIDYQYDAKFIGLGPNGNVDAKITEIRTSLNLGYDSSTNTFTMNSFKVNDLGKISISFSGNILTDWLINIFSSVVKLIFNNLIVNVLENNFAGIFEDLLELINAN